MYSGLYRLPSTFPCLAPKLPISQEITFSRRELREKMDVKNKATKIDLFSLATPQMRTFHMTWFAFFLCFFGWFGIAPLMAVVREDLITLRRCIITIILNSILPQPV